MGTPYRQPTGSRLLIITYYFPPETSVGARRWRAMSRWLRRLGHEVDHPHDAGVRHAARRHRRNGADIRPRRVHTDARAPTAPRVDTNRLPRRGHPPTRRPPEPRGGARRSRRSWVTCWFPTRKSWDGTRPPRRPPGAWCASDGSLRDHDGPPHSTHLIPLALGHRRPAWIADFRDGWGLNRYASPAAAGRWLDAYFERKVVEEAEAVIGVTRPIADDLVTRLGADRYMFRTAGIPSSTVLPPRRPFRRSNRTR